MPIRRLVPADASAFQALRLEALRESPSAFGSSYEEEKDLPYSTIEGRLAIKTDRGVFGAFENNDLIGMVGLGRENMYKLSHKVFIWGMYVTPRVRGKGIGRRLLVEALALAKVVPEIQQINLCVNANNVSAIHIYESVGFKAYGHEPGAMFIDGKLHDELHMYLRIASRSASAVS